MAKLQRILSVLLAICLCLVLAYDGDTCCKLAKTRGVFLDPPQNQICAQRYDPNKTAAEPLYISYTWCASNCKGIGLSKANEPSQWAALLVQFILPSVIFSMTIPRRKKIEFDYLFDWPVKLTTQDRYKWVNNSVQLGVSFLCFMIIIIPVFIDTIIWISVIVIGAGNMLVGGLYEAHLDYRIVKYVEGLGNDEDTLDLRRELLVTITAGNLQLEKGDPQTTILKSLTIAPMGDVDNGREKSRSRLLNLLGAQSSFGSAVGSPVLFFLGAFVYTILDLRSDPSSEDAAISLGFGMEWMIIVHVAIISGCLLASNNPSTSAGIVGADHEAMPPPARLRNSSTFINDPHLDKPIDESAWERFSHKILGWSDAYDTEFQPVSLWSRGINKMKWIKQSQAWKNKKFKEELNISTWGWIFKILIPALSSIALPPAAGGVVAYFTPPRGLGCRSLSFIVYAISQVVVTLIATARNAMDDGKRDTRLKRLLTGRGFRAISLLFWFGSLVAAIGGTTMQITGVYRNCICYSGATNWYDLYRINPSINVAADTQESRDSSGFWVWSGSIATVFMAANCYFGWWYQKLIRHRFTEAVKNMYTPPHAPHQRTSSSPTPSTSGDSSTPLLTSRPRHYTSRRDSVRHSTGGRESTIDSQASTAGSYRPTTSRSEATGEDIGLLALTPEAER